MKNSEMVTPKHLIRKAIIYHHRQQLNLTTFTAYFMNPRHCILQNFCCRVNKDLHENVEGCPVFTRGGIRPSCDGLDVLSMMIPSTTHPYCDIMTAWQSNVPDMQFKKLRYKQSLSGITADGMMTQLYQYPSQPSSKDATG